MKYVHGKIMVVDGCYVIFPFPNVSLQAITAIFLGSGYFFEKIIKIE